jgi:hypothetical protein
MIQNVSISKSTFAYVASDALHNDWNLFHAQIRRKASPAMHLHAFAFHVNKFAFEACILDLMIVELALARPVQTHQHSPPTVTLFVDVLKKR